MLCPFCNSEMIKGKLLGDRYQLKWMPDNEDLVLGIWAKKAIVLPNQTSGFGRPYVKAYICKNCRKLITDI